MGRSICEIAHCTGCGACRHVCPKHCIEMKEHADGALYPEVNSDICINCGKCERVCPQLSPVNRNSSIKAYAAWNNDIAVYETSASGGTASAISRYAITLGGLFAGATINEKGQVILKLYDNLDALDKIQNSKYVFSVLSDVLDEMEVMLKLGRTIFFIGLPCQVAAVKKLFYDKFADQLYLVDLVCHGITPQKVLEQHLHWIEKQYGKAISRITFRKPSKPDEPYIYALSCYDENGELFYSRRTSEGDAYQYGYHRGISYRENCYNCLYATPERCSDLTLGDFRAFEAVDKKYGYPKKVSSVIVNTPKGEALIETLAANGALTVYERPVSEPFQYDTQLRTPTKKGPDRIVYEQNLRTNNGDFHKAIDKLCEKNVHRERVLALKRDIKHALKKILHKYVSNSVT